MDAYTRALNLLIWDNCPGVIPASKCNGCGHVALEYFTTCPECESNFTVDTGVSLPTIADTNEIPAKFISGNELDEDYFDFKEELENSNLGYEVFEAALELDIEPKNVAEAYQGEYRNDEEFAQQLAEDIGAIQEQDWPYTCIDWEQAAREIMYDYSESNGHYFMDL
jgi:antirestriction protein